jgi:hypothetical protein
MTVKSDAISGAESDNNESHMTAGIRYESLLPCRRGYEHTNVSFQPDFSLF